MRRSAPTPPKLRLCDQLLQNKSYKCEMLGELLVVFPKIWKDCILLNVPDFKPNFIASILHCIKGLKVEASMANMETNLKKTFVKVFKPLPHVDELPLQPLAWITLKDAENVIRTRNYPCPWK